jgi:hypothetical protein
MPNGGKERRSLGFIVAPMVVMDTLKATADGCWATIGQPVREGARMPAGGGSWALAGRASCTRGRACWTGKRPRRASRGGPGRQSRQYRPACLGMGQWEAKAGCYRTLTTTRNRNSNPTEHAIQQEYGGKCNCLKHGSLRTRRRLPNGREPQARVRHCPVPRPLDH